MYGIYQSLKKRSIYQRTMQSNKTPIGILRMIRRDV